MKLIRSLVSVLPLSSASVLTPKKLCVNCKHFIADKRRCVVFGETDLVTGSIDYDTASCSRLNEQKCGENALYFEENQYKLITVPYYFVKEYWFLSPVFLIVMPWIYLYSIQSVVDYVILQP